MINFTLTLWVCSFLSAPSVCMPPIYSPQLYDSWYECSRAAHQQSLKIYSDIGYKIVNDARLSTRYMCVPQDIILQYGQNMVGKNLLTTISLF